MSMNCYKAAGVSRKNIRNLVRHIRRLTGLESDLYFPIVQFLELVLPALVPGFVLEIVPVNEIYRWPERSLEKLRQYKFVLTPDYSLYADMPVWRQIESIGKSRWCGVWWQEHGLTVIPTVSWSNFPSYAYCFDGIEPGSTVAVGMIGCKHSKRAFLNGYEEMLDRIQPEMVICFGKPFDEMRGPVVPVDYIASRKGVR